MLSRRGFIAGVCCCAAHTALGGGGAAAQNDQVFCSTIEPESFTGGIIEYSAQAGISPALARERLIGQGITEYGVAALANVWRKGDGIGRADLIVLGVAFINGDESEKQLVRENASSWLERGLEKKLAFEFDVKQSRAQISVKFDTDGNWSRIGRQSAQYAKQGASMHISDRMPWVVKHEFGHALGLRHEQSHPEGHIAWNEPAVIAAYGKMGISEATVRDQVFKVFPMSQRCGPFDPGSVMMYQIPASWTTNGFSTTTGTLISDGDRNCIGALYGV